MELTIHDAMGRCVRALEIASGAEGGRTITVPPDLVGEVNRMSKFRLACFAICCAAIPLSLFPLQAAGEGGEDRARAPTHLLHDSVIGAAGASGSSAGFVSHGTLGQSTPVGIGAGGARILYAGFWQRLGSGSSAVESASDQVFRAILHQNRPNPFHRSTLIQYSLAREGSVEIAIYDVAGRVIRTLVREDAEAGTYQAIWTGMDDSGARAPAGVYFYRLKTKSFTSLKKMLVLH